MNLIIILWTLTCLMAANATRTQVADLKQQVDAGITRHIAMSRDLPTWLVEYETKRTDLENVMNVRTICTRRAWIREKIRDLEKLYDKIKLAWDLKGEQLVILSQILHHAEYNITGLKDFSPDDENDKECEQVLKSLDHYIKLANETHVEEGNKSETYTQELDDKLKWWRTQACDCIWSQWGSWSQCTKTCGEGVNAGTMKRSRVISQDPLNGGSCPGSTEESQMCNNVCCPVDCTWNQWSEWTKCEEKCPVTPEDGKVHRYRSKNEHKCGGAHCQGDPQETKTCHIIKIMKEEMESQQDEINHLTTKLDDCKSNVTALHDKLCALLNCQNEGVCEKGVCKCKPEYYGTSCEFECQPNAKLTVSGRSSVYYNREDLYGAGQALTPISYNKTGFWHSGRGDVNPWIAFKMAITSKIYSVEVDDRKDLKECPQCPRKFKDVEVSVGSSPDINDTGKTSCGKQSYPGGGITSYKYHCPEGARGQYIFIQKRLQKGVEISLHINHVKVLVSNCAAEQYNG